VSDHFSGPRALAGPAGDICDFYAFPSPERPDRLVLVMNVLPLAGPDSFFSDAIVCRFRLRPLTIDRQRPAFPFGPERSEFVLTCGFEAPAPAAGGGRTLQDGWCALPSGARARFRVNDPRGGNVEGLRVWAGLRSDPFFIDVHAYFESMKTGQLAFKRESVNILAGTNVMSIVVEVDRELLFQKDRGPIFGAVAETVVAGKLPVRIERIGRPEIKNILMSLKDFDQVNRDLEVRDLYNLEDPFHMSKDYRGVYRARLNANLTVIDRLDGKINWPTGPDGAHPLTELLLADYLVVDVSKPFAENSYLEIERTVLEGHPHQTCGGRSLNDDVMDTMYTLFINAGNGPRISDGVDGPTVPASAVFPFLQRPNPPLTPQQLAVLAVLTGKEPHEHRDHGHHEPLERS
jgi:Domain of unknown function (DUF4331)